MKKNMKLSTTTEPFFQLFGYEEGIRTLAEIGYDALDMNLITCIYNDEFSDSNLEATCAMLLKTAKECGIYFNQAHAPFGGIYGTPDNEEGFAAVVRSMEIAAILGASIIVVHPCQHLNYAEYREELFAINLDYYKRLIPYAERFGIKIATENMWQNNCGARVPTDSVCSRSREFCRMVDEIGSPYLVGCLDIGHVSLMGADIPAFIRAMGKERLRALHVHDTDFVSDLHTLPFLGKIDFAPICEALGEIGYEGDFTFEAGNFFKRMPVELLPDAARMMYETGRYLADGIERARGGNGR